MKDVIHYRKSAGLVFCLLLLGSLHLSAQPNLKVVKPLIGLNPTMVIAWEAVPGATEYEVHRKENNGAYGAWQSAGTNLTRTDPGLNAASTYTYQVRAKVAGTSTAASNERKNAFTRVWPVRKRSDCVTESIELLHGFGQPIEAGGKKYFHEGIDIQGEETVANECVRAPVGGVIRRNDGSSTNQNIEIEVSINGNIRYINFNHIQNKPNYAVGESVAPGDSLGEIYTGADAGWSTLTRHTHCNYSTSFSNYTTDNVNPFNIWDQDKYRDPQGKKPEVMNTNGDAEAIRYRKAPNSAEYFPDNKKVIYTGADIVAEAVDKQSSDAPWQVPRIVGYYVQRLENGAWKDAVKSAASPYILVDNNIFYKSGASTSDDKITNTIIDYSSALNATTPAGYDFKQWFTYMVTNTKGTTGAIADLDSTQYWATDARSTVTEANGYKSGYDKARSIDEAKFPDGRYRVNIHLEDFVNKAPDYPSDITVDNFRPYVKKVEIKAGKLNYVAEWKWDAATGQLKLDDNKPKEKASGKMTIKITTSEPMKDLGIEVTTLSFSKNSTSPAANSDAKVWEFEIPADKLKNAAEGPHKLLITGHDSADNVLQGFTTKTDKTGAELHKRKQDGSFAPADAPVKDEIHTFKVETKVDIEFVVDDTGSMSEEIESVKNGILLILSLPQFSSPDAGWRFQLTTFKDNVTVRPPTTDLTEIKNQVSALFASGGGDCPEASVEAVDAIKDNVKDNGIIFLFTDAAPHAGTNLEAVAASLKTRGVRVITLLSGDCNFFGFSAFGSTADGSGHEVQNVPYSDNHDGEVKPDPESVSVASLSGSPTAIEAFSFLSQETGGLFVFIPEINSRDPEQRKRFENIVANVIVGLVAPSIINIEPGKGPAGGTLAVVIAGMNSHFNATTKLSFSNPGIVVNSVTPLSATLLQATITIGAGVPLGYHDVTSVTDLGGGVMETTLGGEGLLQVISAPTQPTILSISPPLGSVGQSMKVKVTGINTHFTNASVLDLGSGITVGKTTALSNVELEAEIQISSSTFTGFRDVRVTTGSELATENVPGPFLVTPPVVTEPTVWYRDFDGDGFGNPKASVNATSQPVGYVSNSLDCNDYRVYFEDKDNDGWGSGTKLPCGLITRTGDCDDNNNKVHSLQTFYRDRDGDSYGDAASSIALCTTLAPTGYVKNKIDCDDNNPKVYWPIVYYRDFDGDGLGDPNNKVTVCSAIPPTGYVSNNKDTNDSPLTVSKSGADNRTAQPAVPAAGRFTLAVTPNPFKKTTRIQYTVPLESQVSIKVYDVLGRELNTVYSGQRSAGTYSQDYNTQKLAQGVYYCRLMAIVNGKVFARSQKLVKAE